jgi:Regulator of chromosome condensation (RCC1) repeat/PASTA domain
MLKVRPWARRVGGSGLMAATLAVIAATGLAATPASASILAPTGAVISAYGWGTNDSGELGLGSFNEQTTPAQISGMANVQQVAQGEVFGAALLADGTVDTWGYDNDGELGDGQIAPVHRLTPAPVPGLTGVVQIAAGYQHVLALKSDGTVWAWGYNFYRELGDGTQTDRATPFQIPGLTGIKQVSASYYDSMALGSDGSVWAWGHNGFGELGDGTTTNRTTPVKLPGLSAVAEISAGYEHGLAVKTDGTVWAWGNNAFGELGVGTTTNHAAPVQVPGLTGVTQVAAGRTHSLAIAGTSDSVWAWGDGTGLALGDLTAADQLSPINIGLNGVTQISAGFEESAAVSSSNTLFVWGSDNFTADIGLTAAPTPFALRNNVGGGTQAVQVSLGFDDGLAVGISAATVPNVVGDSPQQAASVLAAADLSVGQVGDRIDCNNLGNVSQERPGAGTQVAPGSAVNLTFGVAPTKTVCP